MRRTRRSESTKWRPSRAVYVLVCLAGLVALLFRGQLLTLADWAREGVIYSLVIGLGVGAAIAFYWHPRMNRAEGNAPWLITITAVAAVSVLLAAILPGFSRYAYGIGVLLPVASLLGPWSGSRHATSDKGADSGR